MRLINWFVATCLAVCVGLVISLAALGPANAASKKPNILIIWGDDIGGFSISANNQGIMGYKTPNIDRIAREGANFTDWYGQQSCTAGRAGNSQCGPFTKFTHSI